MTRDKAPRARVIAGGKIGHDWLLTLKMSALAARSAGFRKAFNRYASMLYGAPGFLLVASAVFWYLRITYWRENPEPPFSDLLGYIRTGENIASHFYFGLDADHPTYFTPITPTLIAIAKLIAPVRFEAAFRILIQIITFAAALGLAREIALVVGKKWIGASFLLVVAICRPSIFWSLKLSTEPVCEAMLYATLATGLATLRTRSLGWAGACGFLALCLGLNRPNFLPGTIIIPFSFLIGGYRNRAEPNERGADASNSGRPVRLGGAFNRQSVLIVAVFAAGYFGTWSLWIGRNVVNYGAFIPTSSSSGQSLLWEYGAGPIKFGRYDALTLSDGSKVTNFGTVVEETGRTLPDFEGAKRLFSIARAWYAANWMDMPRLFLWRLKHLIATRGTNNLTVVPRENLFFSRTPLYMNPFAPLAWKELLLLDKGSVVCFVGLIGVVLLLAVSPGPGFLFFAVGVVPWFAAAAVIGYERTVESLVALTVWLSLYAFASVSSLLNGRDSPGRACQ